MRVLGSLTNRIFLASTLLAMVSIGAAVYFVSARLTTQAEARAAARPDRSRQLVDRAARARCSTTSRAPPRLIADLPKFKAVVETARPADDRADRRATTCSRPAPICSWSPAATASSWRRGGDAGAGDRRRIARRHRASRATASAAPAFWPHPTRRARGGQRAGHDRPRAAGAARHAERSATCSTIARAAQFKALTGADIAFAIDGAVRASTLGPRLADGADAAARRGRRMPRSSIGGEEYVGAGRSRCGAGRRRPQREPAAIILRSRSERMRTLGAIQAALAGIALGATAARHRRQLRRRAHDHAAARVDHRSHAPGRRHRRPDAQDRD